MLSPHFNRITWMRTDFNRRLCLLINFFFAIRFPPVISEENIKPNLIKFNLVKNEEKPTNKLKITTIRKPYVATEPERNRSRNPLKLYHMIVEGHKNT